ncbi:MAG: dihydropteroate synthase [Coriobacteriia bacterium]|nr:dihydropteroate synthase [Coriobacteriia bacterium]
MREWKCGDFRIPLTDPVVMGIVNVTPDSFSDGGRYENPLLAVAHALRLHAEGAGIIDVGGESTRPGAPAVSSAEELARVRPVVARLAAEDTFPVSIDTRHPDVAAACIEAGASIVNDVSGFRDREMCEVVARSGVGVVVMHMLGEPGTMQNEPHYTDVVAEVGEYLATRAGELEAMGVSRDRICVDPGIGFGKTLEHNLDLLRGVPAVADLGYPVLLGASRKRFIAGIVDAPDPGDRLGGSVAAAVWGYLHGASVLRVHDVEETVQALAVTRALAGGAL